MRAVVIDGAGSVRVNTQPDPALPGPDGVVVAVTAAGICGSDLHFYEGEYPFTEPVALGHEAVGTIVEAGPQVRTVELATWSWCLQWPAAASARDAKPMIQSCASPAR